MKFLYGKLYRKYFPIKSASIFYEMDEKEFGILIRWIKNIESDISCWNMESQMKAVKQGTALCRQVKLIYPKPIDNLYLLLKNKQFSRLDEDDLEFVNDVLYRHKYNSVISYFIFPTNKRIN